MLRGEQGARQDDGSSRGDAGHRPFRMQSAGPAHAHLGLSGCVSSRGGLCSSLQGRQAQEGQHHRPSPESHQQRAACVSTQTCTLRRFPQRDWPASPPPLSSQAAQR